MGRSVTSDEYSSSWRSRVLVVLKYLCKIVNDIVPLLYHCRGSRMRGHSTINDGGSLVWVSTVQTHITSSAGISVLRVGRCSPCDSVVHILTRSILITVCLVSTECCCKLKSTVESGVTFENRVSMLCH